MPFAVLSVICPVYQSGWRFPPYTKNVAKMNWFDCTKFTPQPISGVAHQMSVQSVKAAAGRTSASETSAAAASVRRVDRRVRRRVMDGARVGFG